MPRSGNRVLAGHGRNNLLDTLKVGRAVVGGVSMGGDVALAFQRLLPSRVLGLVLVDTRAGAAIADKMLPGLPTHAATPAQVSALRSLMARQSVDGLVAALTAMRDRPDATGSLAGIGVPTLIVHGNGDTLIPLGEAEALLAGLEGAGLTTIAGAAHLPNFERPDAFNAALRKFVTKIES